MFNDRKYINKLKKDIENKENSILNLLDANRELSLSNNSYEKDNWCLEAENEYLKNKINLLEKLVKQHEENECKLNIERCKAEGQLDKIKNIYKTLTGEEIR